MLKLDIDYKEKMSKKTIKKLLKGEIGLLLILIMLCIVFSIASDSFSTANNLLNVTRQISIVLIISIGMLCVLLCGEIDLSVGSTAALAGVACATVMKQTDSIFIGIFCYCNWYICRSAQWNANCLWKNSILYCNLGNDGDFTGDCFGLDEWESGIGFTEAVFFHRSRLYVGCSHIYRFMYYISNCRILLHT